MAISGTARPAACKCPPAVRPRPRLRGREGQEQPGLTEPEQILPAAGSDQFHSPVVMRGRDPRIHHRYKKLYEVDGRAGDRQFDGRAPAQID
jgi:hypothetical protein